MHKKKQLTLKYRLQQFVQDSMKFRGRTYIHVWFIFSGVMPSNRWDEMFALYPTRPIWILSPKTHLKLQEKNIF